MNRHKNAFSASLGRATVGPTAKKRILIKPCCKHRLGAGWRSWQEGALGREEETEGKSTSGRPAWTRGIAGTQPERRRPWHE